MAYSKITLVELHDEVLFASTGPIGRWATSVARELKSSAVAQAPHGSDSGRINKSRANASEPVGSLKRGIRSSARRAGPRQLEIELVSTASYSMYVIKGTGTIYSKSARIPKGEPGAGQFASMEEGGGMYLPANPGYGGSKMRQRVRGQKANNFMGRAVEATSVKHSSLRGFKMG
jgi:hypothetical protein